MDMLFFVTQSQSSILFGLGSLPSRIGFCSVIGLTMSFVPEA